MISQREAATSLVDRLLPFCGYRNGMTRHDGLASCNAENKPRFRDFIPALALLVLTVLGFGVLSTLPGRGQHQLAVLFPPRVGTVRAATLVAVAGGELVDSSRFANLVIATSLTPGFARALYKAGAWLVMDPIVAHGCGAAITVGKRAG
jgi:hypothetical protein